MADEAQRELPDGQDTAPPVEGFTAPPQTDQVVEPDPGVTDAPPSGIPQPHAPATMGSNDPSTLRPAPSGGTEMVQH